MLVALIECIKHNIYMGEIQKQVVENTEKVIVRREDLPFGGLVLSVSNGP
jgi:hypothetical protein